MSMETNIDYLQTRREQVRKQIEHLLKEFVDEVPGVAHALLTTRDALPLVDSGITREFKEKWSAITGTLASLAENIPGPTGGTGNVRTVTIERNDAIFVLCGAGFSKDFPATDDDTQDDDTEDDDTEETVLVVVCYPNTKMTTVGFEMGRLVDRFAQYLRESRRVL
ncbi:roadblock/LC7 domain-containing protein [Streptomyces sp. NPDC048420]|uniref:roadblock/LC7 domain-containing protein n=1 Tax=Streptomyces sp. NPDC048420 TaxID=3155755 RepID=UPI00343484D4